jgi:hypothetical protein
VEANELTGQVPSEMMRSKESISGMPLGVTVGALEPRTDDSVVSDIMEGVLGTWGGT